MISKLRSSLAFVFFLFVSLGVLAGTPPTISMSGGGSGSSFDPLNIASDLLPSVTGTYNVGSSSNRWKQAFLGGATLSASTPAIDIANTWNNPAIAFKTISVDITNSGSATSSRFLSFSLGGAEKFYVLKSGGFGSALLTDDGTNLTLGSGMLLLPDGAAATPAVGRSAARTGLYFGSSGTYFAVGGAFKFGIESALMYPQATGSMAVGSSSARFSQGFWGGQTLTTTVTPLWDGAVTWNDSGTSHRGIKLAVTETADAATSRYFEILGGAAGTTDEFYVLKGGSAYANGFSGGSLGIVSTASIYAGSGNALGFTSRSNLQSPSDGVLELLNSAGTDFNRLQFGGTTSAFPALKRNGAGINFRLADDSADTYALQSGIYGGLYETGGSTAITITTAGTYYQWVNSTSGTCTNMTCSTSSDDITATIAGKYRVSVNASFVSAINNEIITARIFNEGVGQTNCTSAKKLATAANMNDVAISCIVTMAVNDSLDLRFTSSSSATSVTPQEVNINVTYLGS